MRKRRTRYTALLLAALMCLPVVSPAALASEEPAVPEPAAEEIPLSEPEAIEEPASPAEPVPVEGAETEPAAETESGAPAAAGAESPETEAGGGNAGEEETEELQITGGLETVYIEEEDTGGDELFAGYVNQVLGISGGIAAYASIDRGSSLTGTAKTVYDLLGPVIEEIASGGRQSTEITFTADALGIPWWTAADLGLSSLGAGTLSEEAKQAADSKLGFDSAALNALLSALLADYPYELYWFDKTEGMSGGVTGFTYKRQTSGTVTSVRPTAIAIRFSVAAAYSESGAVGTYEMNTAIPAAVNTAKTTAAGIVAKYAGQDDYSRLDGYRQEICDLVSYNYSAAAGGVDYGDPWQLIWVFDGDSSTNVVCEGYAKAFQYLCDLTEFQDGGICCCCVSGRFGKNILGTSNGESHMWNLVTMEDGKNYLTDITNCDSGMAGSPRQLFLAGASGSVSGGYAVSTSGGNLGYVYKTSVIEDFGTAYLTVASSSYVYVAPTPTPTPAPTPTPTPTPVPTPEISTLTQDGVVYSVSTMNHSSWAEVTGFADGLSGEVTLPAAVKAARVYKIADSAFKNCKALTALTIPSSVTEIGAGAFSGCSNLESITFRGDAPSIGSGAFTGVAATVWYTAGQTWTKGIMTAYGGTIITWQALLTGDSGLTACYADGTTAWDSGVALTAARTSYADAAAVESAAGTHIRYTAYDISLTDENGESVTPAGSVTVQLPVPPGYVGSRCAVYRVDGDGLKDMGASVSAGGKLTFATEHFSVYIVAQTAPANRELGDVNGDEKVNIQDAMTIAQAAVGMAELNDEDKKAADYNQNSAVTLLDALQLAYAQVAAP